ncbi:MAG: hypothetical protein ACRC5C_08430 [Bacilli bacterium]
MFATKNNTTTNAEQHQILKDPMALFSDCSHTSKEIRKAQQHF